MVGSFVVESERETRSSGTKVPGQSEAAEMAFNHPELDFQRRTTWSGPNSFKMSARPARFNHQVLIDTTPLPDSIPKVPEIGASSAPLLSASFFIGARCRPYNDDYMACKDESNGKGEVDCMKEGRKVTRCAASVLDDINKHCLQEFRQHWECLDNNNQQLWQCRRAERPLNKCVFDNLKLEKKIPGAPTNETPVHERKYQIYAHHSQLK